MKLDLTKEMKAKMIYTLVMFDFLNKMTEIYGDISEEFRKQLADKYVETISYNKALLYYRSVIEECFE
tara:strand:- start:1713 stop:1916 length:204 start_codon:yes stop_codon:yes gene_type:complete